jgi:hypothetical protein
LLFDLPLTRQHEITFVEGCKPLTVQRKIDQLLAALLYRWTVISAWLFAQAKVVFL